MRVVVAKKRKVGRPRIKLDAVKTRELASRGLSQKQIAAMQGCSYHTLNRNRKRSKEFNEAYEKGVAEGLANITNSLYETAIDGNVTAQIFYLKNRDDARWKDRVETTHDHSISLSNVLNSAKKRLIDVTPAPIKITNKNNAE